jgi:hypothetical protein
MGCKTNYLAAVAAVMMLFFAFSAVSFVTSYERSIAPSSYRSFSVGGEGKAVAVPDIAKFDFGVITEGGKDIVALQEENTVKVNKIIEFAKSEAIDTKDIKTEIYNLEPRYTECYERGCPPRQIIGYRITQRVSIKVRDFSKIGALISGATAKGANSVSDISFTIDDETKPKNEARSEAIARAKEKAIMIAKEGGFKLGKLLSIEEAGGALPIYGVGLEYAPRLMKAAAAPTIEPGSQDVIVNVVLKYEIK